MNIFKSALQYIKLFKTQYLDLSRDREDEAATVEAIRTGIEFKGSNIFILVCAIFIASLGLNTNSAAVIIGAMLISPLMGPIMGVGLGLGIYDFELIKKSFKNLAVATAFSVLASTLYFFISPLNEARSELLARTAPSIYDVLIAFFGGMAGIIALSTKQKGNVIPGVAIATALMPPLCTAGFGLATGHFSYFFGAIYLYFINSVFIAFATTLGVKLFKFTPKAFVDKTRQKHVQRIIYAILAFTIAPSVLLTYNMIRDNYFENAANKFIAQHFTSSSTQVLNKAFSRQNGKRVIHVTLVGNELPQDSLIAIESRLAQFGIGEAILDVKQGIGSNNIDLSALNSMMFRDIYQDNQERIARQAATIDSLRQANRQYRQYDDLGSQVAPEVKVLFPNISRLAISQAVYSDIDSLSNDTTTFAVISYNRSISMQEKQRFKEWLEARLGTTDIQVLEN